MNCPNCGKEYTYGERFCGGCGTPLPATAPSAPVSPVMAAPPVSVRPVMTGGSATVSDELRELSQKCTTLLICIALMIAFVPLVYCFSTISLTGSSFGVKYSFANSMFGALAYGPVIILVIIASLLSFASFIIAMFDFRKILKRRSFVVFKITSIFSIVTGIITIVYLVEDFVSANYGSTILVVLISIGALVLEFILSKKVKSV